MRTTRWIPVTSALAAGLLLAGCGGGGGTASAERPADPSAPASTEQSTEQPAEQPAEAPAGPVLTTGDTDLGRVVTDADGRTVYVFAEDEPGSGESACTGGCAATWPAVVAGSDAPAADGLVGELGTLEREDGTLQATLDGRPLYLFAGDGSPGDATGQAVDGTWFVVGDDGVTITEGGTPSFSY